MNKSTFTLLLSVLIVAVATPFSFADSPGRPSSYVKPSADGRYLFVMIAPFSPESEASYWGGERATKIRAIRKKYRASGLYRNDGSPEPLWTVDWYAFWVVWHLMAPTLSGEAPGLQGPLMRPLRSLLMENLFGGIQSMNS